MKNLFEKVWEKSLEKLEKRYEKFKQHVASSHRGNIKTGNVIQQGGKKFRFYRPLSPVKNQ